MRRVAALLGLSLALDLKAGPDASGAFAPNAWVSCEYKEMRLGGHSARAERYALKLLAAFVQHTDNKAANMEALERLMKNKTSKVKHDESSIGSVLVAGQASR
jgi:hypothetical protein